MNAPMKSPSLYTLTGQHLEMVSKLKEMNFDELTLADTIDGADGDLQLKYESCGFYLKDRRAFAAALMTAIADMQDRLDVEERHIASFEKQVLDSMVACNYTSLECPYFTIKVQDNPPKVEVLDETQIPAEYWRTPEPKPPVPAVDKVNILKALKDGKEVAGCQMVRGKKLVIK